MAAHNNIIQLAGDYGIVGIVCFVGLQIHLLRRILRMRQAWHKFYVLCLLLFINFAGMTESDIHLKYFGLTLAIIFVVLRLDERLREAELPGEMRPAAEGAIAHLGR